MARVLLAVFLLLLAAPVVGDALDATSFTNMGWFRLPSEAAFGARSIAYVPDCLNDTVPAMSDPSPSDGYPGCMLVTLNSRLKETPAIFLGQVILVDIPVPDLTGSTTASIVTGGEEWDVNGDLHATSAGWVGGEGKDEFALTYDNEGTCRIVWSYYREYGELPYDDNLIFGYSDCDPDAPNEQGMWRPDSAGDIITTTADPYRATMWVYDITKIPQGIADDYFDGDRMLLGPGKSFGSRGSSLGPSIGVRPWTFPTDSGGWDEFTPIVYYKSSIGYSRWYVPSLFRGANDQQTVFVSPYAGQDMIRITVDGTDYEASITVGARSIVDMDSYPANSAAAKPTEPPYDVGSDTYQSPGSQPWADPTVYPVEWYGIAEFNGDYSNDQNPSNQEFGSDGVKMPSDANLISTCSHGTGPSSQKQESIIFLYDLEELGEMYAGTSIYDHDELQPYAEVDVTVDADNDGVDLKDTCIQPERQSGVTVDRTGSGYNLLYFSHGSDATGSEIPYSTGGGRGISVYRVEPPSGHTPATPGSKNKVEGAGVTGGGIG